MIAGKAADWHCGKCALVGFELGLLWVEVRVRLDCGS